MLAFILDWSLRHRLLVVLGWLAVAVLGVLSALRLPLDAFPDTTPVQVQVNTSAAALAPLEIERQISRPVETAIAGLPGLAEVRSVSKFGFSQVTVTFEDGTDIYLARQVVTERLQALELPAGIERPKLGPVATGLGEVFHYVLSGTRSLAELRTIQDYIVKPQLRSVPGVAEVNSWGGHERQIQVIVDPLDLQRNGLTLQQLAQAIESNNTNVGGGTLDQAGESLLVQGIGIAASSADVEEMVVTAREGVPVRVRDVARVVEGHEIRRGAVTADGRGEVVLGLGFMLMGENSHDVTRRLELRLAEIQKSLPPGVTVSTVYERTELVERVLRTVRTNLLEGALLVIAVLFAFLGNLRAGLIVAAAIPLSLLFASNLMLRFGIAGSLLSLGAIDFGLVVDGSVIQVENVMRRLSARDNDSTRSLDLVRDAVIEVRRPTLFGELIIAIVYLPILTLEGVEGKLFKPMALTVIFTLAGAMLLSLTLIPVLASLGLVRASAQGENRVVRWLGARYRPVLRWALGRPWLVITVALLALANAALLATQLGSEFIPRLREGSIVINTVRLAGVSVDESARYGTQLERLLLEKFPDEIERVWTRTGAAEIATDPMGVELSDIFIMLKPPGAWRRASSHEQLVRRMSDELSSMPGMRTIFTQPIEMRLNEMAAGIRSDLGIKLFGDDFELLREKAREVEAVVAAIPGATDVLSEQVTGQPMLTVRVDRKAIARHGIPAREVLAAVESLGGHPVGALQDGDASFPITVRLAERYRTDAVALGGVLIAGANGDWIPLAQLATITLEEGPSTIHREWGKRRVIVQANVHGRDLGSFVREAERAVREQVALPSGYYVRFGGQFEHLESARARLLVVVPLSLALIFGLLFFTYRRIVDAVRVFSGVPFAAVGGVLALWLRELPFSISAAVGFIALSGVSVLADMVLVSTVRQRLAAGFPLHEAIEQAAHGRLRPVLMTALVASVGFLPMALNTGFGAEIQRPLATVVIGGVISSTLLTLVVLPALYRLVGAGGQGR
jgi:cobalt-zinc-cadmium resistance protein CzcA